MPELLLLVLLQGDQSSTACFLANLRLSVENLNTINRKKKRLSNIGWLVGWLSIKLTISEMNCLPSLVPTSTIGTFGA